MPDQVNGAEAPALPQESTEPTQPEQKEAPEFPFIRNAIAAPNGSTDLIYNFKNGQFAGVVTFRVVSPEALAPIAEDFLHFSRDLLEQVKAAKAAAAAAALQRQAPQLQVVPADALKGMKRPT